MKTTRSGDRAIRRYLSQISKARRGSPADETRGILESVQEHLDESLRQLGKEVVDAADIREVLAGMAPPESYGTSGAGTTADAGPARTAVFAYAGLACIGAALLIPLMTLLVIAIAQPRGSAAMTVSLLAAGALLVAAMCLGAVSFRHPAGKAALFCSAAILLAAGGFFSISGRTVTPSERQPSVESIPAGG